MHVSVNHDNVLRKTSFNMFAKKNACVSEHFTTLAVRQIFTNLPLLNIRLQSHFVVVNCGVFCCDTSTLCRREVSPASPCVEYTMSSRSSPHGVFPNLLHVLVNVSVTIMLSLHRAERKLIRVLWPVK